MVSDSVSDVVAPPVPARDTLSWKTLLWFGLLVGVLYAPVVYPMVREWTTQDEMSHGFFVPVVAGYIVWAKREELVRIGAKPNWWALGLVVWGFFQSLLGVHGADFFVARTGFYLAFVGVIWTVYGTRMIKALLFPLFLLLFMIRIPLFIYSQITFPLQLLASDLAADGLGLLGYPVLREGNVLELPSQRLSVVEACSGVRSMLSLAFLSLVYGYFFDRRNWVRTTLLVATVPIAILANAFRVTLTGVLGEYDRDLAHGLWHTLEGWIIFVIALACLFVLHGFIDKVTTARDAAK